MKTGACLFLVASSLAAQVDPAYQVKSLRVEVLSTMLTSDEGIGEWGFAAVVEADGHRILFDTGARPDTVLNNARELGVDLANITDVVLSHDHSDHTGGLMTLRRAMLEKNPAGSFTCLRGQGHFRRATKRRRQADRVHGHYQARLRNDGREVHRVRSSGGSWNGIWLTGPVPRKYPEQNWSGNRQIQTPEGWKEDNIPEDMSLVINTAQGLVVVSGCGHSGIVNTLEYARSAIRNAPIFAAIGGFHLYQLDDDKLRWTAGKLKEFGLGNFLGAHCTGIEAVYRIRELTGLDRKRCAVGAVGAVFDLNKGLDPGSIAS